METYARLYVEETDRLDDAGRGRNLHSAYNSLAARYPQELRAVGSILSALLRRSWKKKITPSQFVLLDTIYDRTLGWLKISEVVTLSQLTEGILYHDESEPIVDEFWTPEVIGEPVQRPKRDPRGIPYFSGVNLGKMAILRQLRELVRLKYLERIEWGSNGNLNHAYRLRVDWVCVLLAGRCFGGQSRPVDIFVVDTITEKGVSGLGGLSLLDRAFHRPSS
jgi:hypothetical protein